MGNFSRLNDVSQQIFLEAKIIEECKKEPLDKVAVCTLLSHVKYSGQRYYRATLTEEGFRNLIIAHHVHGNVNVSEGGEPLIDVVSKYYVGELINESDQCQHKVQQLKTLIDL